ncbi:unnamed protein product [Rotaria sp. Silwood1]|nr:unnamed protein product [Rotaria sp. Silwood1]CAF1679390.1 unnamed protein product [Rotaria sp. Silwood1]CAF3850019.1 unnamed protein product [Rotaria sp. Silwood1]CAF3881601.1 unnamed protein product [Rotaria sp. Silwood1]CAF3920804.1 unnamed protein product [Rotaria sp. Silwood1]
MASGVRGVNDRQRFLDINEEPDKLLPPLPMPVTGGKGIQSLRECVKPVLNLNLAEDLLDKVAYSLEKCKHPKDGLTQDQSAALYLYSLQTSFYKRFNGVLRDEDRTKAIPFYDYYRLFMSALNKLPSIQDNVWRGVTANLSDQYSPGSIHIWHAASSCSDQVHITDTFLNKKKHRTLFNIKCYNGKTIKNHSHYPNESETILPPGTCIRVKSQSNPADKLYIVSCEEIILTPEEMNNLLATGAIAAASAAMPITTSILYLLWLDPNVNKSKENVAIQEKLRVLFKDDFQTFDKVEECELSINQKNNDHIILIVSGQFGRKIVPEIHDLPQLELVNPHEIQSTVKTPLSGYEKQPLMSLEEALKPVDHLIEELPRHVADAKRYCTWPKDGLTQDESASIMVYGMELGETSLYRIFNVALRSEDRHKIKPWFPYLKLFMTALHKLPSFQGLVWRSMQDDFNKEYTKGQRGVWWSVSLTTSDGSLLENFMHGSGKRTVFTIECKNGKSIRNHSKYPNEEEVLLMPGFYFEVTSVFKPAADVHIITLKEIDSPW